MVLTSFIAETAEPHALPSRPLGSEVPKRIVSLVPSATELLFALGAGAQIVAVTRYDDAPEAARVLPKVGGLIDPEPEAVLRQNPDMVIALPNSSGRLQTLARLGIRILVLPAQSLDDLWQAVTVLGAWVDKRVAAAALRDSLQSSLQRLQADLHKQHPVAARVAVIVGRRPLVAAGPGSFLDSLLSYANGINVVQRGGAFVVLDAEVLARLDPAVIIDLTDGEAAPAPAFWQRFPSLRAVRNKRVVMLNNPVLVRPGPRLPEALNLLAHALWGP